MQANLHTAPVTLTKFLFKNIYPFPPELLLNIVKYLDLKDVLAIRQTSKLLRAISTDRQVWVSLFRHWSSELLVPPLLEAPLRTYTFSQLELIVKRRTLTEALWVAGKIPYSRREFVREELCFWDEIILLDGGRWVLFTHNGRVFVYDLESTDDSACRRIIDLEPIDRVAAPEYWIVSATMVPDANFNSLSFNLYALPVFPDPPDVIESNQIHLYHLTVNGHGNDAVLNSEKLKSLHCNIRDVQSVILHGDYIIQELPDTDGCSFEVYNWLLSDSSVHYKAKISLPDNFVPAMIVPFNNGQCAVISDATFFYKYQQLKPISITECDIPVLQPYHILTEDLGTPKNFSPLYRNSQCSRMTVRFDNTMYGLTLPFDTTEKPWYQQLSDFDISDKLALVITGVTKIFFQDETGTLVSLMLNWKDSPMKSKLQPNKLKWLDSTLRDKPSFIFDERSNVLLSLVPFRPLWVVWDLTIR